MSTIPDTGGGLSGFLARLLWCLFQHLPFTGGWDWFLLFLLMGILTHLLFLPLLWKSIAADMEILKHGRIEVQSQTVASWLWCLGSMFFCLWFFSTEAGRTFLAARHLFGMTPITDVNRWLYWGSLLSGLALMALLCTLDEKVHDGKAKGVVKPEPFHHYNLRTLYAGGGIFVTMNKGKPQVVDGALGIAVGEVMGVFFAHVFYWYWSAASIVLMYCFVLAALLTDCVRIWFVYILHKRTFQAAGRPPLGS